MEISKPSNLIDGIEKKSSVNFGYAIEIKLDKGF